MSEQDTAPVDEAPADELADFDEFWQQQGRKGHRIKVCGEVVELPPSLPLQFELEAKRLQRSKSDTDVRKMVGLLFGADSVDRWAEAGMDGEQFAVTLMYATARVSGVNLTMAEAYQAFKDEQTSKAKGGKRPKRRKS